MRGTEAGAPAAKTGHVARAGARTAAAEADMVACAVMLSATCCP